MSQKIRVKLIMRLAESGMSQNAIARLHHISKRSISDVLSIAKERGISFGDVASLTDEEAYRQFYPDRHIYETVYRQPDYAHIHEELKRVGVTLKLLWQEYQATCSSSGQFAFGYTKFCMGYEAYTASNNLTNHLAHRPGDACEVDWSGKVMKLVDRATGEVFKVFLFVGTLPYSQYSYVEPCLDCKERTWLRCHIHMYEFFGGVPRRTICDNLKTGVIAHPREGEIVLNEAYEAMANHYMTAIMPAPVKRPKAKASVEGTVGKLATAVIARLRNETFHDFDALKKAVRTALNEFNKLPFQKRPGSRYELWLDEKNFLEKLPDIPYELAEWLRDRKVYPNCHVSVEKNFYSVPHNYAGHKVDVKLMEATLEIYHNNQCISRHRRFPKGISGKYDTRKEDMPPYFNQPEMNGERMCRWADKIGPATRMVVDRIFESVRIQEQVYNSVLSVLKLDKKFSPSELEAACRKALEQFHSPRYRHLKAILSAAQSPGRVEAKIKSAGSSTKGLVRGASYYGGDSHAE